MAKLGMADNEESTSANGAQKVEGGVAAGVTSDNDAGSSAKKSETERQGSIGVVAGDGDSKNNSDRSDKRGESSQKRKNAKWKQGWKEKRKEKRRRQLESDAGEDRSAKPKMIHRKMEYNERGSVAPHEGSFASESMQKLFGVGIDGPSARVEGGDRGEGKEGDDAAAEPGDARVPKRKLAMLVSFVGSGYSGFQINAGKRTLHAELELALYRAGIVSVSNFGHPTKYSWSNSARTDKGVHAAAQVCSFKGEMVFHGEGVGDRAQLDAMRRRANEYLPDSVRVLDFGRVTKAFCARTNRDRVRYQYMVPSFALCSREEVRAAFSAEEGGDAGIAREGPGPAELARARIRLTALAGVRVAPDRLERLRDGLRLFEGTHPFHNYTRRIGPGDASAARYIISFRPLEPVVVPGGEGRPDAQWIPLQVVGQSFLLNQIRKMVSAAVDVARGAVSPETIRESLTKGCRMKVNVAPAQGLFLDRSYFELYNKHKVQNVPKLGDGRDRETLDWVEEEGGEMPPAVRRIEEFKAEKIIPHIVREEAAEGNFLRYLYAHDVLHADESYSLIDMEKSNKNHEKI